MILQNAAHRVPNRLRHQPRLIEVQQRLGPVEGLRDAWAFVKIDLPQLLHEGADLLGKRLLDTRDLGPYDLIFFLKGRVIEPEIEAAAFKSVVDLTGAVRG